MSLALSASPQGALVNSVACAHSNKLIADVFFKAGYIEVWGRGIAKILAACSKAGLPEPLIDEYAGGILVTFRRRAKDRKGGVGERVGEKVGERVGEHLSANQEKILSEIRANPRISARSLASILGISVRKTEENLRKLRQQGSISRIGPARGADP